jgi:hypothetical protein
MTLVEVRCEVRGCGLLLHEVGWAPPNSDESAWAGLVFVYLCPWHGGAHGSVAKWVEARRRRGLPHDRYPVGRWVPWADLRAAVEQARLSEKTQVVRL